LGGKKHYGVAKGRQVGIYLCYGYVHRQTDKYPGALHQGFMDIDECLEFMGNHATSTEDEWNIFDRQGHWIALMSISIG